MTAQQQLMVYMRGFRIGASGSAWNPSEMKNEDFQAGHEAGRKASQKAYAEASVKYAAKLCPLREVVEPVSG